MYDYEEERRQLNTYEKKMIESGQWEPPYIDWCTGTEMQERMYEALSATREEVLMMHSASMIARVATR